MADIRAKWIAGDPAVKEQIFQELTKVVSQNSHENSRLARGPTGAPIVLPPPPSPSEKVRDVKIDIICREFPRSDLGNSRRFAYRKRGFARYCHLFKAWFVWDGKRWGKDTSGKAVELAKEVITEISDEAVIQDNTSISDSLYRWALTSQARPRIDAALYLAQSAMPVEPKDLDAKTYLMNLPNGTLNLLSYELMPHDKKDLLTKIAGVEFKPGDACPLWLQHLDLIFGGDRELIEMFQQVCGYTLMQENPDEVLFILYGHGKNGKSKTLEVLSHIFGEYGVNIAADTLMKKRMDRNTPRGDIARISNARFVSASEGEAGEPLAEAMVKALTGNDKVTVRRLYEAEFDFKPTAKIWLATNHRPIIKGTDNAIWRRIWLIPFSVEIPEEKRDPDISKKLIAECSGILNWMIEGLKMYQKAGRLIQPEKVRIAVEEYRQDSDILKEYLDSWCEIKEGIETAKSDLYRSYSDWCDQNHEKPVGSKRFTSMIRDRGIKERMSMGKRYWVGIALRGFWK